MSLLVGSQYVGRKNVQVDDAGRLGEEFQLPDISRSPNRFDQVLSGMQVTARLVKFADGGSGTLAAKDPVFFAVNKYGTEVGAKSTEDGIVDGIVDPFLGSTTISPGDTFLLFTRGPCNVVVDGAVATTHVKAAGSGKFVDAAFGGASYAKDVDSRVARLLEDASAAADGDTVRVYLNCGAHG
jgi:hypothetical protein